MTQRQTELRLIRMSEVELQEVRWLWYPYIPQGKLTIIQGNPGEGKTTLALWIAAICSQGQALPGKESCDPINILYQTAELGTREYRSMDKNQSWKLQLMIAIEDAMAAARSREHFIKLLARKGYKVKWTDERKSITYTTPSGMKCRDIKLYDSKFLKEMMESEFKLRAEIIGRFEGAVPQAGESSGRIRALPDSDGEKLEGVDWPSTDANSANGGDSDSGGAAGNQGGTGGLPRPASARTGELHPRNAIVSAEFPAGDGAVSKGNCEEPIVTGWENERRIFEESLLGAGADEEVHGYTVMDRADPIGNAGDIGTDLAYLSANIAGIIDEDHRPQDGSSMPKQKRRKRALGQKPDEHDFEQKM